MTTKSARTLIAVPTLGRREDWLRACVASILNQPVKADIVLVGPEGPINSILEQYRGSFTIINQSKASGLTNAINAALDAIEQHEYFSWLGDDDLLSPGSLGDTSRALDRARPETTFVYGRTRYIDAGGNTIGYTRPGRFAAKYLPYGKDFIPQPGSLIRISSLRHLGPLDNTLRNAMDLDMFLRLLKIGPAEYLPMEVSAYRLHDESITVSKSRTIDESDLVRRRQRSPKQQVWSSILKPLLPYVDRAVDISTRHGLTWPEPATVDGTPYTQVAN